MRSHPLGGISSPDCSSQSERLLEGVGWVSMQDEEDTATPRLAEGWPFCLPAPLLHQTASVQQQAPEEVRVLVSPESCTDSVS